MSDESAVPVAFSSDPNASALLIRQTDGEGTDLVLHDLVRGTARTIVRDEPELGVVRWGPGGDRIDAWWYAPTRRVDGAKVPLVVYFYGGAMPVTRRFDVTHQVLAGNGYTVVAINPRGAIGFGQLFADAYVNDWGPKAAGDIVAGVDAFLGAHPDVDRDRIGIYGGSYGGFMTEYLVSTSDLFAAAVSLYGISDLSSYWGAGVWGYTYGDTAFAGSSPWTNKELFVDHSPLYSADRINTPLLLVHGTADTNVPPEESEQLYTALSLLDREVELVTFPGEDHGVSGTWRSRVEHRKMIVEWFDRFLRGQPEAWEARWAGTEGGSGPRAQR